MSAKNFFTKKKVQTNASKILFSLNILITKCTYVHVMQSCIIESRMPFRYVEWTSDMLREHPLLVVKTDLHSCD